MNGLFVRFVNVDDACCIPTIGLFTRHTRDAARGAFLFRLRHSLVQQCLLIVFFTRVLRITKAVDGMIEFVARSGFARLIVFELLTLQSKDLLDELALLFAECVLILPVGVSVARLGFRSCRRRVSLLLLSNGPI